MSQNTDLHITSEFLDSFDTCVIATVSKDGHPEAATVGFSHDDSFVILIGTNTKSRKYNNLITNPTCALVVGLEGAQTVQLEGTAKEVNVDKLGERLEQHYEKVPAARRFQAEEGQTYFLITPTWLRHTNYTLANPIFEMEDFS